MLRLATQLFRLSSCAVTPFNASGSVVILWLDTGAKGVTYPPCSL